MNGYAIYDGNGDLIDAGPRRYCVTVQYRTGLGTLKFAPVNVRATDEDGAMHIATNYAREQLGDFRRIVSVVALVGRED